MSSKKVSRFRPVLLPQDRGAAFLHGAIPQKEVDRQSAGFRLSVEEFPAADLLSTIRAVHSGLRVIPPDVATAVALHAVDDELSDRELEILRQVADGLPNKLIADRLKSSLGQSNLRWGISFPNSAPTIEPTPLPLPSDEASSIWSRRNAVLSSVDTVGQCDQNRNRAGINRNEFGTDVLDGRSVRPLHSISVTITPPLP